MQSEWCPTPSERLLEVRNVPNDESSGRSDAISTMDRPSWSKLFLARGPPSAFLARANGPRHAFNGSGNVSVRSWLPGIVARTPGTYRGDCQTAPAPAVPRAGDFGCRSPAFGWPPAFPPWPGRPPARRLRTASVSRAVTTQEHRGGCRYRVEGLEVVVHLALGGLAGPLGGPLRAAHHGAAERARC